MDIAILGEKLILVVLMFSFRVKKFLFTLFILFSLSSGGQNPLVKMWDYRFGGTSHEELYGLLQLSDGNYLLWGSSQSNIGGDKTQNSWNNGLDYWIIKIDAVGNKFWDKNFGGTGTDWLYAFQQTNDGGFILGGSSSSGMGGDKTQANRDPSGNTLDYWLVKIDSVGNLQWDKTYGGDKSDVLRSIVQTSDGGYLAGGFSFSGISADKTQALKGGNGDRDFWIVKTDSLGNKLWDKDFGGFSSDLLFSLIETTNGNFILGGWSSSGIGGDKSQNTIGNTDYWILKIDSSGNKIWDKDFGGNKMDYISCLGQTHDGGLIIGGDSWSAASGDKSEDSYGQGDFWIIKTDSNGIKEWDRDYGGIETERLESIQQTIDGGYIIAGYSYSNVSGDKSENNLAPIESWAIRTDSNGYKLWDKTFQIDGNVRRGIAIEDHDGCFVLANDNNGVIAGDKSQNSWNAKIDYWIIKVCETIQAGFYTNGNLCPGTCVDYYNLSIDATNYQWSFPGASPDTSTTVNPTNICYPNPGSYDVQLIVSNANGSDTLYLANYITVYPAPPPQSITQSGDTLFAIPGTGTYQWFFNGNMISGATDYFIVAQSSGDYNIVATDSNGCEVEAAMYNVLANIPLTVDGGLFTIIPNPVIDELIIKNEKLRIGTATVYDIFGRTRNIEFDKNRSMVDCRLLSPGLYFLELSDGQKTYRLRFIKQ